MDLVYVVVDALFSLDFWEAIMYAEQNFCVINGSRDIWHMKYIF